MIRVIDCEQGTPEWYAAKRGIPSASNFSAILAKGEGKMRRSYLCELAAEIITGETGESFQSAAMARGKEMEAEARALYAFVHDAALTRVGFIINDSLEVGCSPDSLIDTDGGLEIKTQRADLLVETIMKDAVPGAHVAQLQGSMWATGRKWWDLVIYWPKMPLFVKRVQRDEKYIRDLAAEVERFNGDLDTLVSELRRRSGMEARAA